MLILGSKILHLLHFRQMKSVPQKLGPVNFKCSSNPIFTNKNLDKMSQSENMVIHMVLWFMISFSFPAGIYLIEVNNRNTRTMCEICSKLTIKIPERRQCFNLWLVLVLTFYFDSFESTWYSCLLTSCKFVTSLVHIKIDLKSANGL